MASVQRGLERKLCYTMYQHVACKNMATVQGILDEQGLSAGLHMIWVEHDLWTAYCLPQPIRAKVTEYSAPLSALHPLILRSWSSRMTPHVIPYAKRNKLEERKMKYFGGCDVGSTYTKAVILDETGKIVADTTIRKDQLRAECCCSNGSLRRQA